MVSRLQCHTFGSVVYFKHEIGSRICFVRNISPCTVLPKLSKPAVDTCVTVVCVRVCCSGRRFSANCRVCRRPCRCPRLGRRCQRSYRWQARQARGEAPTEAVGCPARKGGDQQTVCHVVGGGKFVRDSGGDCGISFSGVFVLGLSLSNVALFDILFVVPVLSGSV